MRMHPTTTQTSHCQTVWLERPTDTEQSSDQRSRRTCGLTLTRPAYSLKTSR
ncbi:hypothetical protein DPMN_048468 [Dreissena polymorpha]|uniref:Uncharacterized protein n=1 Tax=Dreissena polymorpha TaxID=45954 RepID=A0A9D4I2F9_DREPO|nr:hypothetical protein DPMN_048468 [Dreissena polymorpha]